MDFKEIFRNLIPSYFRKYDTNKDSDGKGMFERYTEIPMEDLEETTEVELLNALNQKIAYGDGTNNMKSQLIPNLATDLSSPPSFEMPEVMYRRVLNNLSDIWRLKGTKESIRRILFLYGYDLDSLDVNFEPAINHDTLLAYGDQTDVIHDEDGSDITYDDWYLPSFDELEAIYNELKVNSIGGFDGVIYWSSTEQIANFAKYIDFSDGSSGGANKTSAYNVLVSRDFQGTTGDYSLQDEGPAGGYIYYITDNGDGTSKYYEAKEPSIPFISWGAFGVTTGITSDSIGDGKSNTSSLVVILDGLSETLKAAQVADDYSITNTNEPVIHDDGCQRCLNYSIEITNNSRVWIPPDNLTLTQIRTLLEYVQPVNLYLETVTFN